MSQPLAAESDSFAQRLTSLAEHTVGPSVEFLLFLHRERLFQDWASADWRPWIDEPMREWEDRQARSTLRRYPTFTESQSL